MRKHPAAFFQQVQQEECHSYNDIKEQKGDTFEQDPEPDGQILDTRQGSLTYLGVKPFIDIEKVAENY